MRYRIESGLPVPAPSKRGRPQGSLTRKLERMKVGQHIKLGAAYVSGNRYYALYPKQFMQRKRNGRVVIWRTK